jgi:hypoxanthine phosphoribosyltransferase
VTFDDQEYVDRDPLIDRILIPSEEIQRRVTELGREISGEYTHSVPILVSILKGGVMFHADLQRRMSVLHEIDFLSVSSYHGGKQSTGVVRIVKDLKESITDRDVVLVEDIVDTGRTLSYLLQILKAREPRSLKVVTLLNKVDARIEDVPVDWVGFDIPNEFVIGYGLDWQEKYRNLPFIGVLKG